MSSIFLILQFVLAVVLTILVLLQKSASLGLGAYSGSNESLFGAKGPAGFLAKITFILGVLFIANTITLGYFYNQSFRGSVVKDEKVLPQSVPAPVTPSLNLTLPDAAPKAPAAPATNGIKNGTK